MNLLKRYKAWRNPPEDRLREIQKDLSKLENRLLLVINETGNDPFSGIVEFFNLTSAWHDDNRLSSVIAAFVEVNDGRYDSIVKQLYTLSSQMIQTGRQPHGMNRTKPGETVTAGDVWIGGIYGLVTHPISKWRDHKRDDDFDWHGHTVNVYDVMREEARKFVMSHAPIMAQRAHALAKA